MNRIRNAARIFFLVWALFFGASSLCVPVAHAAADCYIAVDPAGDLLELHLFGLDLTRWATKLAFLVEAIALLGKIWSMLNSGFDDIGAAIKREAMLFIGTINLEALLRARLADAAIDNMALNAQDGVLMSYVMDNAAPMNSFLCKRILLGQLPLVTQAFEEGVSALIVKAVANIGRGPKDDYSGPAYVADEEQLRAKAQFASLVDGYAASAVSSTTVGEMARTFVDADLSPFTMDGVVPLELPEVTTQTIALSPTSSLEVNVPDPQNDNQKLWVAGLLYCVGLAGPRPSPAWGAEAMETPAGRAERAVFYQGVAQQNAAVKACADLMAYYTRPNKTMTTLINEQKKRCFAAKGYVSDDDLQKKFAGCERGLSPYQADELNQLVCKSSQRYLSLKQALLSQAQLADETIRCSYAWAEWQAKIAAKQGALVDAVRAFVEVKDVWPASRAARQ